VHCGRLAFKERVKKQDLVNWRVRFIEGAFTRFEEQAFRDSLDTPVDLNPPGFPTLYSN
jgi:hypothetical protein